MDPRCDRAPDPVTPALHKSATPCITRVVDHDAATTRQLARNANLFIAFRVLFNARFYYPVFAILFLDFGLTMEQFALLNVLWAVAIIGLEVPSGALADQIGRKRMVVIAAVLMVIEMALLAFLPLGNITLVFAVFCLNRILSGAAEASASGADEALAYDSMAALGLEKEWPNLLARLMRWQSAGFFVAMILGAAMYDPAMVQRCAGWLGIDATFDQQTTMRFPIYLCLLTALAACVVSLAMREPPVTKHVAVAATIGSTIRVTLNAGKWILHTPAVLVLIVAAVLFDSMIRLFLTVGSQYYRLIELPEATFGLVGAGFALIGFVAAPIARRLVESRTKLFNFALLAVIVWLGLLGLTRAIPVFGVLFVIPFAFGMSFLGFFLSHYLNAMVESSQRATVLSFKGVAMNIAYGGIGLLFAALMRYVRSGTGAHGSISEEQGLAFFAEALQWFPWYFLATMVLLAVFARWRLNRA